ncbi:MAG TPA: hypothetical protein VMG80_02700 [Solirubrobacteraceae bacterium]|nr:hypothetical protein [Solirubrobacteraceae bacterium]
MRAFPRLLTAALLGVALAVALVSCGSSGKGLIPTADAGPLQSDFEEVAQAAQNGNGNCKATTEAINKTERDFAALPASIDPGLHDKLSEGISNLRERALALCAQPLAQTNTTTTPRTTTTAAPATKQGPTTTSTGTTSAPTSTAPAQTPTTPATTTPSNNGGGTAAPGSEEPSAGPGGGTGIGGESSEGQGNGHEGPGNAQENGK